MAAAGWSIAYVEDVVAHHHPSPVRDRDGRRRIVTRNALWFTWLRRPPRAALAHSIALLCPAIRDPAVRRGALEALRGLPWVLHERRRVPALVEARIRTLATHRPSPPGPLPGKHGTFGSQAWERGNCPASVELALPSPVLAGKGAGGEGQYAVSIVIPTYRRDDGLRHCLEALARQDVPAGNFEIIVVDDA